MLNLDAPIVGCSVVLARVGARNQPFVFFVRTDPEPNDVVSLEYADHAIAPIDSSRINRWLVPNPFESKPRVLRIQSKHSIGIASLLLDGCGKIPKRLPESSRRVGLHRVSGSSGFV